MHETKFLFKKLTENFVSFHKWLFGKILIFKISQWSKMKIITSGPKEQLLSKNMIYRQLFRNLSLEKLDPFYKWFLGKCVYEKSQWLPKIKIKTFKSNGIKLDFYTKKLTSENLESFHKLPFEKSRLWKFPNNLLKWKLKEGLKDQMQKFKLCFQKITLIF